MEKTHWIIIIVIVTIFSSCTTKESYLNQRGCPTYLVSLLNINGEVVETKYCHKYRESMDFGPNTNYVFTYYGWRRDKHEKYGCEFMREWSWPMDRIRIKRVKIDC